MSGKPIRHRLFLVSLLSTCSFEFVILTYFCFNVWAVEYVWFDKKNNLLLDESHNEDVEGIKARSGSAATTGRRSESRGHSVQFDSRATTGGRGDGAGEREQRNPTARQPSPLKSPMRGVRGTALLDLLDEGVGMGGASPRAISAPRAPQPRTPGTPGTFLRRRLQVAEAEEEAEGAAVAEEELGPLKQQTARVKREKNSDMGNDILEGYLMSAGLDQRVYLWNLSGKCVGMFGAYGWEIDNEASWFKGVY